MDGAAPSLPPISAPGGMPAMSPGGFARPAPAMSPGTMPVGRPAADPEVQQQRVERSAERKRIEGVAPKALDSRAVIYRARDGKVTPGAKPVISITVKELEDATGDGQTTTDDVIAQRLEAKGITAGKFIGRFVDRAGRLIPDSSWDIEIGEEDEDPVNEDDDAGDLDLGFATAPEFGRQAPPPPPALDTTSLTGALRAERQDEAKRGSEMAALMAQQSQTTTQMMLQLAEQNRQAEERARRDAAERDERESKRRAEFRQTLLTLVPLVLPMIQGFFKRETPAADPAAALMLEVVKAKLTEKPTQGLDVTMMGEMAKLMQSMVQGNLVQQQEMAKAGAGMQAEVLGVTMKTALSTMREIAEMKPAGGDKEESTLAQIAKIAGPILAGMQQQQAQQPQAAAPTDATFQQVPPAQAEVVEEPRRPRRGKVPPPPVPTETAAQPPAAPTAPAKRRARNPSDYSDSERIRVSLDAIRRLSTGEIEPNNRFNMLTWLQQMAPASMLEAVKAGDHDKVMELGSPVVITNPVLMDWVGHEHNVEFLMTALNDLKMQLDGTLTRDRMDNAIIDTDKFVKTHRPTPGQRVGPPQATVIPPEGEAAAAAATTPPAADAPPASTPPASTDATKETKETKPRAPRKPRAAKQQPPADPNAGQAAAGGDAKTTE